MKYATHQTIRQSLQNKEGRIMKKEYSTPEIKVTYISADIITFSEQEEWTGPMIGFESPQGENEL